MKLTSPAFRNDGTIPSKYTCDGENISPELNIEAPPSETKTFALIMEDPDVPRSIRSDGMWDHWIVWNIPKGTRKIPEGTNPQGVLGKNTRGNTNYGGPCPPDREHRYFFKLFALDTSLNLPGGSTKQELLKVIQNHIIEKVELIGKYKRK
ncbi:MAG: YbhB/YbcL family Raf kinase inhibitor-like protein [Nanoarchaeota archaeon]